MNTSDSIFTPLQWHRASAYPFSLIAGPCSAESEEQVCRIAKSLSEQGVSVFRASLWKPRTRPGGFEGVGSAGIPWLQRVRNEFGLQIATEVATPRHIEEMLNAGFNTFWIGARTTSSPFAITDLADCLRGVDATVLVKNPINPDIELWEGALLRLKAVGLKNIGAIHRGFSTYGERKYRNTPLWQIPIELKRRHPALTLLADPSHIGGSRDLIEELSREAMELHYDGLIIETHHTPEIALSDASQQITPQRLREILHSISTPLVDADEDEKLKVWRSEIDRLDNALIDLLSKRMELVREIGAYKDRNNLSILQPNRYRELMRERAALGEKLGLNEALIHDLFSLIHESSIHLQQKQR